MSFPSPILFYITPHFRLYGPHLHHLALERLIAAQEWQFYLRFLREERGFSFIFQDLSFHQSLLSEKNISKYENSNFSLVFSTKSILFINFKIFSFIELHETHSFTSDCRNTFSLESHERHQNRMKHVSSWSYMKILSYEAMLIFSHFGQIFTTCTWFWMFSPFWLVIFKLSSCDSSPSLITRSWWIFESW